LKKKCLLGETCGSLSSPLTLAVWLVHPLSGALFLPFPLIFYLIFPHTDYRDPNSDLFFFQKGFSVLSFVFLRRHSRIICSVIGLGHKCFFLFSLTFPYIDYILICLDVISRFPPSPLPCRPITFLRECAWRFIVEFPPYTFLPLGGAPSFFCEIPPVG